ncbi:hypothetical protein C1H46_036532 [Malus baccata]|uniref:Protein DETOXIFICATION n=1 Tax=Malus baccata TaxID=106549 RepID=A0A540KUM1_MALBA|nr:hypothetical protein C1H46_036532 [Malus baccata]
MEIGNDQNTPLLVSNHSGHEDGGEEKVGFVKQYGIESKKLWKIAGPAIFTSLCQYSLGALTQTFAGFVGDLELAAVSIENSVIAGLAFGVMVMVQISIKSFSFFYDHSSNSIQSNPT